MSMLLICLVLPVNEWLLLPLESRFPQPDPAPPHVDGIIVLGGAVDPYLTAQHGMPALNDMAERMTAFVALARQYPQAHLAFTGGSGVLAGAAISEADVARTLFTSQGLDRPVTFETHSRSTYENAVLLQAIVTPRHTETWLLVTSASHMPRAIGSFRKAGWPVVAWPVAYKMGRAVRLDPEQALPGRLGGLDMALHEWIGLLGYRVLGRTEAVFPGPE